MITRAEREEIFDYCVPERKCQVCSHWPRAKRPQLRSGLDCIPVKGTCFRCLMAFVKNITGCEPPDALGQLLRTDCAGLLINQPIDAAADVAFQRVCRLGLEDIVSKKIGSRYESGRSSMWLKTLNPSAPALQRLEQEDWRG